MKGDLREDLCFCPAGWLLCGGAGGAALALIASFARRGGRCLFRLPAYGWGCFLSSVFAAALLAACGLLACCRRRAAEAALCGGGLFFLLLWTGLFFAGSGGIPPLCCLLLSILCALPAFLRRRVGLGRLLLALTAPFFFPLLWLQIAEMLVF